MSTILVNIHSKTDLCPVEKSNFLNGTWTSFKPVHSVLDENRGKRTLLQQQTTFYTFVDEGTYGD